MPRSVSRCKRADQRQHDRPRSHRILAGLDVDIRDGGGPVMNQHLGDFVVHGARAVERFVVAPHAAVMAILPAIVGNFHHAADENLPAKLLERGLGRLFMQPGLFRASGLNVL